MAKISGKFHQNPLKTAGGVGAGISELFLL